MPLNEDAFEVSIAKAKDRANKIAEETIEAAIEGYMGALPDACPPPDPGPGPDPDPGPDPAPTPSGFKVFEDINYRGRPNLQREFGMIPLKIHYESAFFDDKRRAGDFDFTLPETHRIVSAARSSPEFSCIDIERWWSHSDDDLDDRAAPAYEHVANIYDDALDAGDKFGFYSTIPIRSLNKISGDKRQDWEATNSRMFGVGEIVDMTFPSLYTLVDDFGRWPDYARANIDEAYRIAPGKPCYPFLWPQMHPNADSAGDPVPAKEFRKQLDLVREECDGVVIWTLSNTKNIDFDNIPPWWNELTEFLKDWSD